MDISSPENDVISLLYSGKNYQITNDTNIIDGRVRYSVTFDGQELSEYAVGFNLKTTNDNEDIVILRSSEVVPVTNILGGQIRYDVNFIYDEASLEPGCTNPTAVNYNNAATIDDGSCTFSISGCTDPEACSCDNLSCLQFCEFCGTVDEYRCVAERGFYNQNPNAFGGECTYPQNPITIGFTTNSIDVENFNWTPEYRLYDDEEFMYTYIGEVGAGGFNNSIEINFGEHEVDSYSFDVEGVHFRECRLTGNQVSDCQLNIVRNSTNTTISVFCDTTTSLHNNISCSVDDIIKIHSCIKNSLFLNGGDEITNTFSSTSSNESLACFDLNPTDDLEERLIKLNKLNGKLYTHISDLHRGENKFSIPFLTPFCCKNEWEVQEPQYQFFEEPGCDGNIIIDTPAVAESCTGDYSYSCGAPNSGDVNASGTVNIQDVLVMISYILENDSEDSFLNQYDSPDGIRLYAGDTPLCNFAEPTLIPNPEPDGPPGFEYTGIADMNADGEINIIDVILLVDKILESSTSSPLSLNTGNCRTMLDSGQCLESIGCTYNSFQPGYSVLLDCQEIYDGLEGEQYGYQEGDCPEPECTPTLGVEDDSNPYVPGTDRIVQHSSELLKCGDSVPQIGIINPEDFWDFDISTLLSFYNNMPYGEFLEYTAQCTDLGGYSTPDGYNSWRGETGPFRDLLYQMEYLGADIGEDMYDATIGAGLDHARYGALQLLTAPQDTQLFIQVNTGQIQAVNNPHKFPFPHAYSPFIFNLCKGDGYNGNIGDETSDNPPLVNDEFCQRVEPSDSYSQEDPYGWVAKSCCNNGEVRQSFKIPYYGIIPFFNTEDYYYKYSEQIRIGESNILSMGYVPPCKEFLYDKITTALAYDETISDNIDELGYSYSIRVIEYETELISHVIITGDTLPTIWLGTLTDLNLGEGYEIVRFTQFGSPTECDDGGCIENDGYTMLLYPRFQMQYDSCGICSEGSALHISNSEKDDDNVCCLYPNKIIKYYQEDNQFNTGVGKTYLNFLDLCDSNDDVIERNISGDIITFHSEFNSDNCPGTLDCLGVCHEELTLEEASLLTTYAQIDAYGGCCLQGNIDLCGVCNGDSSSCETSGWIPAQGFFELDITDMSQSVPISGETNYNTGTLNIQINSDTEISEIKFTITGLNVIDGYFMTGYENPYFDLFLTPVDNGTDIVISSILSEDLFPTLDAGTFFIQLQFNSITLSADEFIINESQAYIDWTSIQGMKLNQFIQSNNTDNLYTPPLSYYGCPQSSSTNYSEVCENLTSEYCIEYASNGESYCIYSFIDCNGDVNGDAFLNICGVCVGGNTGKTDDNEFPIPYNGFYGQDCNGDCFGTAHINSCDFCVMGNTGLPYNHNQDCFGICGGNATLDDCNVCNTPENQNQNNGGCGCFVPAPIEHHHYNQ